jgi:hypothetical protein
MAVPTNRQQFRDYCLRSLGYPVIEINVDPDQVEDRIDEALKYYWDYHFDGSDKSYYKHQITEIDKQNKYITMPENIIGVINIFDIGGIYGGGDMFNIRYQIALNDLYTLTSVSLVPYFMAMHHLAEIQQLLVGKKPIRYNRHINKLYIDTNWDNLVTGQYILVEAYEVVDPDVYEDAWGDRWLARYCTALIKKQWGNNTKKFKGMKMPGGLEFSGQEIFEEATQELQELEKEMIMSYSLPNMDMIG